MFHRLDFALYSRRRQLSLLGRNQAHADCQAIMALEEIHLFGNWPVVVRIALTIDALLGEAITSCGNQSAVLEAAKHHLH